MTIPRFAISQISTLAAGFDDDLRAYAAAGAEGIGIWELKLTKGREDAALEQLDASGLVSTVAVPLVPSILPFRLMEGPSDPQERIDAYCRSVHRLAPFRPSALALLTGPGDGDAARATVVEGMRTIAAEARATGLRVALEPYSRWGGEDWTIINTIPEAVELIKEAGVQDEFGVLFDVWHLWDCDGLEEHLRDPGVRILGVHVGDVRRPTRSFADRVLPGDGVANVPHLLGLLERAGWEGFYELEIFSDNGAFGNAYPDSLWDVPVDELAGRGRDAFFACWERRS
jgi:sugar phosphate isomerase/epimerase